MLSMGGAKLHNSLACAVVRVQMPTSPDMVSTMSGTTPRCLLTAGQYVAAREAYHYDDEDCSFVIEPTPGLTCIGSYKGIFARGVPKTHPNGINLRRFEEIVQQVFRDSQGAQAEEKLMSSHCRNLRSIAGAVVHWKNASQHGRAISRLKIMMDNWRAAQTVQRLLEAHRACGISEFCIPGVAIPTASAFLRFLNPVEYGVMDRIVTMNWTQGRGITHLTLRKDGYILNTSANIRSYHDQYVGFLRTEAEWLNSLGMTFEDISSTGGLIRSQFRACDIEMALWQRRPNQREIATLA